MQEVSAALDSFTQSLQDTEFPNGVDDTQQLLTTQVMFKQHSAASHYSGVPRGWFGGVQTPPPEIPKISVESLIA